MIYIMSSTATHQLLLTNLDPYNNNPSYKEIYTITVPENENLYDHAIKLRNILILGGTAAVIV